MTENPFTQGNAAPPPSVSSSFATQAEAAFRELVLRPEFPCLGAKAALNAGACSLHVFPALATASATASLGSALHQFTTNDFRMRTDYASFVAIFEGPQDLDEIEFENLLWQQLRGLHRYDAAHFDWDPNVRSDPADPHFSFSFGGQALYVIGMHAKSSRQARQFPWPTLVFNPHEQFERLRSDGKWKRMQDTIRSRDLALQGSINPMLSDFGIQSEARQYSGRAVEEDWRAPFQAEKPECPFHH
jgi:FPC/CPF motif-containing protein YcgG